MKTYYELALEKLEVIGNLDYHFEGTPKEECFKEFEIIKSALEQAEKTEKAIELAKQIGWGNVDYVLQFETYEQFMGYIHNNKVYDIVKEAEFDLLKEVFEKWED